MYTLYVDESGDEGDYEESKISPKGGSSKYFTAGGIIVDNEGKTRFNAERYRIVSHHLHNVTLPPDFVLHYVDLRERRFPFDKFSDKEIFALSNDMFSAIINFPCQLLSATIDLENHCNKYVRPLNPRAYSLIMLLERFQHFLEEKGDNGVIIYEELHAGLQRRLSRQIAQVSQNTNFKTRGTIRRVLRVERGEPTKEPLLEFADFFAYAPYVKCTSGGLRVNRWNSLKHKYYNFKPGHYMCGFVEV